MLNLLNLWCFLVLILAKIRLEDNKSAISTKEFGRITVIINLVAVVQLFEATYTNIFKHFFTARFIESGLLGSFFTYFGKIKIDDWGILHLHYLMWLQEAFHLTELYSRLLFNPQYIADIVKFINNTICCSMADVPIAKETSQKALAASLDSNRTEEEFVLKLYKTVIPFPSRAK